MRGFRHGLGWNRTNDLGIKSPLLCQLSYRPEIAPLWVAVGEADDGVRSAVVNGDAVSVDERRGRNDDVRGVATCARPVGSR